MENNKSHRPVFFIVTFLFLVSVFTTGCESEVNLMAPYKSTPVIVGILDYTADTQFVRINRTYLSADNNMTYAQVKDSVEYAPDEVEARLYKKRNGEILDSIDLQYITKQSREPGAFYNQNVGFYYTDKPLFTTQNIQEIELGAFLGTEAYYEYTLVVKARGETYTATTDFPDLSEMTITTPQLINPPKRLDFYREVTSSYNNVNFTYTTGPHTYRYLGVYRFNFDYILNDGTLVENQFIDFKLGAQDNMDGRKGIKSTYSFNGRNWYEFLGTKIRDLGDVKQIKIHHTEFRLTGANQSLTKYLKASNPVSDFTPTLSTYSNIDNGALGILGSRTTMVRVVHLSEPSLKHLNQGEYTSFPGLSYCVIDWAGSNYVCNP